MVLLENLEKKINAKFDKQEELNEKLNDDLNKIKTDIENLRTQVDKNTKNVVHALDQIEIIFGRLNDLKSLINTNNDLMNSELIKMKKFLEQKLEE